MATRLVHGVADRRLGFEIGNRDYSEETPPSAGNPYTAGMANPDNGGGADGQHIPSSTEIGIIVGVVFLVFVGVSALFFRRARKRRHVKDTEVAIKLAENQISAIKSDDPPTTSNKIEDDRATSSSAGDSALHFEVRKSQRISRNGWVDPSRHSQDVQSGQH